MKNNVLKRFFEYVEIRTKITSVFAFLMTLSYLFYIEQKIDIKLVTIFFASMFLFDLTTTAINNYIDTKTNGQQLQFKRITALGIIYVLFVFSTGLGLYLAYLTDVVVLMLGGLCFLCGVLYTYGPIPISRQPLGELFSGVFYGFLIPFILLYISMPEGTYISLSITPTQVNLGMNIMPMITVLLLSVAPVCTTANIMLANNICDMERDIKVKRFTLPYYLEEKALGAFKWIYYIIYIVAIVMVVMKIMPIVYLIFLLTIIPVQKNIKEFEKKQDKATTFIFSIKNFIIVMSGNVIAILISEMIG